MLQPTGQAKHLMPARDGEAADGGTNEPPGTGDD